MSKVLIVDDSTAVRKQLAHSITSSTSVEILEAGDGQEAMDIINKDNDILLVISDLNMPDINGLDLLQMLRENDATKNMNFVMLSAISSRDKIQQARDLGAIAWIVKPPKPEALVQLIDHLAGEK